MRSVQNLYNNGDIVNIIKTGEAVTIFKWKYVKNMKRYSYIVKEYPSTFFFEEELTRI